MIPFRKSYLPILPIILATAADRVQAQSPAYEIANWKTEMFAGYASVNVKPGNNLDRRSLQGWAASIVSYQFFRRWGLTAEFEGTGKDGTRQRSYLFGGTYRGLQRKRFALTGRILAGGTRWEPKVPAASGYRQQMAFTVGFGQSIDFRCSENLALRVQPDIRFARFQDPNGPSKNSLLLPVSLGVVYQFGRR